MQLNEISSIQSSIEEIVLCDDCCKDPSITAIHWHDMGKLRVIDIGNNCFEFVTTVSLFNLPKLQSLVVGWSCFFHMDYSGEFHLYNCEELKQIQVGLWSFYEYSVFDVHGKVYERECNIDVDSLRKLTLVGLSFTNCSFQLMSRRD